MKLLLVNRHMNIGGVETYLYRLCAGLVGRGHSVGLLTEGGLFEAKAAEAGACIHKVRSLAKDWPSALPELQACGYELVHAHNYHSARVGRRVAAALGKPYLMSVHGPRPRLKQLFFRDWSERVVAMSEGDRDNISWWGGVSASRVTLCFYGIDTDRFHPGIETTALRAELGLEPEAPVLLFVSRFSNRKADVGHALLDAMPGLLQRFPSLTLLLVGEGPESAQLGAHLTRLNQAHPRPSARMIGPRKDVERFMALASVAVCTANTALEAMACGTPTIAAGRTGYFGPVDTANFAQARALCFADHGRSPEALSPAVFLRDLPSLLADTAKARNSALATAAHIATHTSVPRMAEETEALYRELLAPTHSPRRGPA
jgi:glycosyltransferase involved in cell wall biosynthesis